ncbi:YdbL family protein [Photobacterium sp. 1_MG-2023]|uniref:YdbL family protein n=1 Tax=Photobacterium sp. 1_MG-2023 TaxID=3062646 RepID=UPI0026E363D4|nr:YdbL family protein [Photobacterium sp. 1_MG-2023]MDO6707027.1 YdbL family protein [Photobacterium sp. 1_MG-2023]
MKRLLIYIAIFLFCAHVFAIDLQQAKAQGLVGEANNGYLAPVTLSPSSEVRQLIQQVNIDRKESYQRIAVSNGLTLSEVARLAYQKAVEKTESGHFYQNPSGLWVKK